MASDVPEPCGIHTCRHHSLRCVFDGTQSTDLQALEREARALYEAIRQLRYQGGRICQRDGGHLHYHVGVGPDPFGGLTAAECGATEDDDA